MADTLELHERTEHWDWDNEELVWEKGEKHIAVEPSGECIDPEAFVHVYSSCCGCNYDFTRKQTEQLRDFLTELLKESQDDE